MTGNTPSESDETETPPSDTVQPLTPEALRLRGITIEREKTDSTDTRASTNGELPLPIAVALTLLTAPILLVFTTAVGVPALHTTVLYLCGVLAAVTVTYTTTHTNTKTTIAGVVGLWLTASLFAAVTTMTVFTENTVTSSPTVTVIAAAVSLLTPFGVLASSTKQFGHGAARTLLSRYLTATIILASLAVLLIMQALIRAGATTTIAHTYTVLDGITVADYSVYIRGFTATVIYTLTVFITARVISAIPFTIFFSAANTDRVERINTLVSKVYRCALAGIGVYFLLLTVTAITPHITDFSLVPVLLFMSKLGAATPLLITATLTATAGILILGLLTVTRRLPTVTPGKTVEIFTPPLLITIGVVLFTRVTGNTVTNYLLQTPFGETRTQDSIIRYFITTYPDAVLLAAFACVMVLSAVLFSIPTFIAGIQIGDESLAGLTTTVTALAVLILLSVTTHINPFYTITGIVLIAMLWEIGEYTTVATGELQSPRSLKTLPPDFYALLSLHAAAVTALTIIALLAGITVLLVFTTPHISATIAGTTLLLCVITFTLIIKLLPG